MSNPTSNFGWQMPTNSDLVTDLPADFEVFGQAVDTSLADLKGGTTGQILSKASGTDMDFTWINNDQGDITGVTAGTGLTGGGTSGSVTLDFDIANYGGGQYAAGKNKIINGDFNIWQRGTSFSGTNQLIYTTDRWQLNDFSGVTSSVSQQTFTAGTAPVSGYEGTYFARWTRNASPTNNSYFSTKLEDVRLFAGQQVTFSFWAKSSTSTTITAYIDQNYGSSGSATTTTTFTTGQALTTSWARYSFTATMGSISGKTIGTSSSISPTFFVASSEGAFTVDLWGVQLEAGSTATPFQTATGTKQGELAACQRYYWREGGDATYQRYGNGSASSTVNTIINMKCPVTMRVAPTSIDYSTVANHDGVTVTAVTSLTLNASSKDVLTLNATVASGLTQYRPYELLANNSTSSYIGANAEL